VLAYSRPSIVSGTMPPIPGMVHWHHYLPRIAKTIKQAYSKAARTVEAQLSGQPQGQVQPILVRSTPKQPIHPLARIRQSQSRWYSTVRASIEGAARHFTTSASDNTGSRFANRASYLSSRISAHISQSSGRAPFASTLRPNLTGGALGRTAGGYTVGSGRVGGARYFSHGPACQAQVVQNVSHGVRAFVIGGQKAQYDGMTARGEKRYKAITALEVETSRRVRSLPRATPGSYVNFRINPTITALTPVSSIVGFDASGAPPTDHLNTEGLLDVLSADFSRALKDLAATLNDLRRLSLLGDLPITYQGQYLRVHFPGVDAETVERLCEELNVTRGMVTQDPAFDAFAGTEIALLFPFAPSNEASHAGTYSDIFEEPPPYSKYQPIDVRSLLTSSASPAYSTLSARSEFSDMVDMLADDACLSSLSGYQSVRSPNRSSEYESDTHNPLEYQGFEGIYRFIEELDAVRR